MRRFFRLALALFTVSVPLVSSSVCAQDDEEETAQGSIDAWAEAMAQSMAPRWGGPEVEWPMPSSRPDAAGVLRSFERPVNVHVGGRVSAERAARALSALELAHDYLAEHAWPVPTPDGGRGGTAGFDLYLLPGATPTGPTVRPSHDVPHVHDGFDAVVPFVTVDDHQMVDSRIEGCVVSAYVQAALLGADPAEARSWRVATGDFLAWLLTGHFGCGDEGVVEQQQQSWRTWIGSGEASGEGGALFLAMLSARTDGLTGDFIRDLWTAAPQRSWNDDRLRAAPDMWQVVNAVMEVGQDPLQRFLEEVAISRYFSGPSSRSEQAPLRLLRGLPEDAAVPIQGRAAFGDLPRRFEPHGLELEPYGSAYLELDTSEAPAGSQLRIWLSGELGVGWALSAVRLGADGVERGRVRAPVRRHPRSYIPVELTDDETHKVVIVVTNMGGRLVDADDPDDQVRSFRLILDRGPQ